MLLINGHTISVHPQQRKVIASSEVPYLPEVEGFGVLGVEHISICHEVLILLVMSPETGRNFGSKWVKEKPVSVKTTHNTPNIMYLFEL